MRRYRRYREDVIRQEGYEKPLREAPPKSRKPPRQSQASKEAAENRRMEHVTLQCAHIIQGKTYGPGMVRVQRGLAQVLREQDFRVVREERRMMSPRSFVVINQGKRALQVAGDQFENALNALYAFDLRGEFL